VTATALAVHRAARSSRRASCGRSSTAATPSWTPPSPPAWHRGVTTQVCSSEENGTRPDTWVPQGFVPHAHSGRLLRSAVAESCCLRVACRPAVGLHPAAALRGAARRCRMGPPPLGHGAGGGQSCGAAGRHHVSGKGACSKGGMRRHENTAPATASVFQHAG